MQAIFHFFLALLMGSILAIYLPMNGAVSRYLGSPITANLTFFALAFVTAAIIFFAIGDIASLKKIREVPNWLFLCGVVSAFMILGTTFLIPKIGAREFFVLMVSGQVLTAMAVSHFGFLGLPQDPVTLKKSIGAALVIGGVLLSTL